MKKLLTLCFSLSFGFNLQAQCIANAGNDFTFCTYTVEDSIVLGGNPTATGGLAPYKYIWETDTALNPGRFPASFFLDDTTSANPILRKTETLLFYLTVSDSLGNVCHDTVSIYVSAFEYTTKTIRYHNLTEGDSVSLSGGIKGTPPLTYFWSPTFYLSDSTIENPFAFPVSRTIYSHWITDSIGCYSDTVKFDISVFPVSVKFTAEKQAVRIYPHPVKDNSLLSFENPHHETYFLLVFNMAGQLVSKTSSNENSIKLGEIIPQEGIYFFRLVNNAAETVSSGKLVR